MKKTLLFLCVLGIVVICLILNNLKSYADDFTDEYDNMFDIQEEACLANEKVYNSFEWDETYIYPGNFAGTYIDYDTLHVLVTDEEGKQYFEKLLSEYKCIKIDIVNYSYNYLYEYAEKIYEENYEYNILAYGVDVIKNKAFIDVLTEEYDKAISKYGNDNLLSVFPMDSVIKKETSIIAGSSISVTAGGCTLGGSGFYNSSNAFITCGHGMTPGGSLYWNGTAFGTASIISYSNNAYGDYSIVLANSGYTPTSSFYYTPGGATMTFDGSVSNPAVGQTVHRFGSSSYDAYGSVYQTGITATVGSVTIKGLTSVQLSSGTSIGGDSGAPCRIGKKFCGVHCGSSTSGGVTYIFFTPYAYPNNTGFSIKIN